MCAAFLIIAGLVVALGLGHVAVKYFVEFVRWMSDVPAEPPGKRVPNWITGLFERSLAFLLVLFLPDIKEVGVVLLAWMTAKLASNWQRQPFKGDGGEADQLVRVYSISALMAGTLSLGFGILGGTHRATRACYALGSRRLAPVGSPLSTLNVSLSNPSQHPKIYAMCRFMMLTLPPPVTT